MPLISVIVPIYNVEPYIRRCIDSILSQTFTDFELILVDDGSPDSCPSICDEYSLKDKRIHVIHQKNGGLSAARNAGIDWAFANSNSQWISFVDSDDWIHPKYLEFLYAAAKESAVNASVCLHSKEYNYKPITRIEKANWNYYDFEDLFCLEQTGFNEINAWAKLYKKNLFLNQRFPAGKINEDLFVIPKVLYGCGRITVVNAVLYYYFQSENSIMRRPWNISRLDEIEASKELICFLHEKGLVKAEKKAIKRYIGVLGRQKRDVNLLLVKDTRYKKHLKKLYRKELLRYHEYLPKNELSSPRSPPK